MPYWWIPHLACWNHGYSCHMEARYQTYHGTVEGHTFHKCEQYVSKFMGFVNQLATYITQYPNVHALFENILEPNVS